MRRHKKKEPLRIIQITDLHLQGAQQEGLGWCGGCEHLDTAETLTHILDDIQVNEPCFDALVVTGDIAQDGEQGAYSQFSRLICNEGAPVYCLPGNHDQKSRLAAAIDGNVVSMPRYVVKRDWLMLFLDSSKPGEDYGNISTIQLEWIKALIANHPDHHAVLFIHHHPVPIGSTWLDEHGLENGEQVLEQLRQLKQIKAIVCGHIHQQLDQYHHGIRILGTPSTCLQFKPESARISFAPLPPAYRRIEFHSDGSIVTEVVFSHQQFLKSA
jgi:Icc protein